jgi:hypothetical protein
MTRRQFLTASTGALGALAVWQRQAAAQTAPTAMQVYKDPQCGCCSKWVEHMRAAGFKLTVTDTDLEPIRTRHRIPRNVLSCHTGLIGGYIIEGHVPAADVKALLAKKPAGIMGIGIPGMPASAPGMDMQPFTPYTVISFDTAGKTAVFAKHDRS